MRGMGGWRGDGGRGRGGWRGSGVEGCTWRWQLSLSLRPDNVLTVYCIVIITPTKLLLSSINLFVILYFVTLAYLCLYLLQKQWW